MTYTDQRQGGWVASFVIVGILLTLGLIGGIYYVKSQQQQLAGTDVPAADEAAEKAGEAANDAKKAADDATDNSGDEQNQPDQGDARRDDSRANGGESSDDNASDTNSSNGERNGQTTESNANTSRSSDRETDNVDRADGEQRDANGRTPSTISATGELPQTGPEDLLYGLIGATMMTFAGITYLVSRRP